MAAQPGSIRFNMLLEYLGCVIDDEEIEGGEGNAERDLNIIFEHFLEDVAAVFADVREQPPTKGH